MGRCSLLRGHTQQQVDADVNVATSSHSAEKVACSDSRQGMLPDKLLEAFLAQSVAAAGDASHFVICHGVQAYVARLRPDSKTPYISEDRARHSKSICI